MEKQRMTETVITLYSAFRQDNAGTPPTGIRMHPEDWYKLLSEVHHTPGNMNPDGRTYMGMTPLIDPRWKVGFPICVGPQGAAEAHEAGARAWR